MFSQPFSPPIPGPIPSATPRQSRLRGLSYLRNYTHNHILSRESHNSNNTTNSGSNSHGHINNNSQSISSSSSSQVGGVTGSSPSGDPPSASRLAASSTYNPATSSGSTGNSIGHSLSNALSSNPRRATLVDFSSDVAHQLRSVTTRADSRSPSLPESNEIIQTEADLASASAAGAVQQQQQQPQQQQQQHPHPQLHQDPSSSSSNMTRDRAEATNGSLENAPSIRFSAYYDPRYARPSLTFPPISRTLTNGTEVIRVGRYSERDSQAMANMPGSQPSAAPVGFKSKVVSRRHCEFWYENGKWYIKDVKSSSGTFLNHIRLSPPSQESRAFPVNDGDIVQLGIDFKGGEEMIFRCVKMRLELNRGWQNKPNSFNIAAHKRLRTIATNPGAAGSSSSSQDCSICLNSIAPCQSLFVAPCSHTWHFKCVRSLLTSPQYPIFICPNCRAGADLEADVEEANEEWLLYQEAEEKEQESPSPSNGKAASAPETAVPDHTDDPSVHESDAMDVTVNISPADSPANPQRALSHATSEPLQIKNSPAARNGRVTPSPPSGVEGPITPRNDAGPWVFDGRGPRRNGDATAEMRSLDATAEMDMHGSSSSDDASSR